MALFTWHIIHFAHTRSSHCKTWSFGKSCLTERPKSAAEYFLSQYFAGIPTPGRPGRVFLSVIAPPFLIGLLVKMLWNAQLRVFHSSGRTIFSLPRVDSTRRMPSTNSLNIAGVR